MQVFLSVAEDSADMHAAALVRTAASALPSARFHGLTGPRLRALGVETVFDLTAHAAMLAGVLGVIRRGWQALRAIERSWQTRRPDLVLLLDSPELNLRLARRARALGVPVLYYIAPQTWASRAGRNRRIATDVDHLACILPFEEPYFRAAGVSASYVGHPLFESLATAPADPQRVRDLRAGGGALLALLPGSRRQVIEATLPMQLRIAQRLAARSVACRLAISAVDARRAAWIDAILQQSQARSDPHPPARVVVADNASLLTAADLVLVASGTATLEVAHYRAPQIVLYDAGFLGAAYSIGGKFVVSAPHLSLVNLLAGARIVPEFMPRVPDLDAVAAVAQALLGDERWRQRMRDGVDRCLAPLEASRPSVRVCELMRELVERRAVSP